MWFVFTPDLRIENVRELGVDRLRTLRLDALLLDVDCTLKDYYCPSIGPEVASWVRDLTSEGIRMCLVSNGRGSRIGPLADGLGVPFVAKALKPFPNGCKGAVRKLGLDPKRTAMVGDQLFADVAAGRLAGLYTILVRPTTLEEPWFTRLKRPLERFVLRQLEKASPV
jgi:hypothetical protein